ncbi:MAG: hypothetical protein LBV80_12245 [Deltaproteobacteria bacterium]|jgi:hypothetical protein|nr:hypothetical protein [Deltaproteobacteria bacterium]
MAVSLFSNYASMLDSKQIGELWRPKSQRIRVGDNVGLITSTSFQNTTSRNIVVANGDDVSFKSTRLFLGAKSAAQSGINIRTFRSLSDEQINAGAVSANDSAIYNKGDRVAFIKDGVLSIYEKKENKLAELYGGYEVGEKLAEVKITDDMRVSWDGENNPVIHMGGKARTGGVLQAQSNDEILIRHSGADVVAGNSSVVFNMSEREGNFSGGNGATFLGSYTESVFKNLGGNNVFAGYFNQVEFSESGGGDEFSGVFENSKIESGEADDKFSGYFFGSEINGGDGKNVFSGLFLGESKITGGAGDDRFNGRFIGSSLDGGAGNDTFGNGFNLSELSVINPKHGFGYAGLEADFIEAVVEGGEGDDKFDDAAWGGSVNLGAGNDKSSGVFSGTIMDGGEGDDNLTAMYAANSVFSTGLGNDGISLSTSVTNVVKADEGKNTINLGNNRGKVGTGDEALGGDHKLTSTTWQTVSDYFAKLRPLEYGEQRSNYVDASKGENTVNIRNGQGNHQVKTGTVYEEDEQQQGDVAAEQQSGGAGSKSGLAGQADQTSGGIAEMLSKAATQSNQQLLEGALNPAGADETGEKTADAEIAKKRKAIGRYVSQSGDAPITSGVTGGRAATVHTGQGEDLKFNGIERMWDNSLRSTDPGTGLLHSTRRSDGFGRYIKQQSIFG